jgi:Family of unknown function (DUF6069)
VRIVLVTAIAIVLAVPLDLAIEAFARQAFAVSPDFEPFQGTIAPYSAGGVVLAGVVFAVLRRFVHNADRVYVRVAIVALVLSWIPDAALLVIHDPGATVPVVASLMVMHAATAAVVVTLLVRGAGASSASGRS